MKPITADNNDGRVLLALRAGAMTSYEFSERGLSVSGWLIKEGLVDQVDGIYRITDAGLAACPLRNPLAARKVGPATSSEDESMNISQQQVLDVIASAGTEGIKPPEIAARVGLQSVDKAIRNHLYRLKSCGQIETPEHGLYRIAAQGVTVRRSGPSEKPADRQPPRKVVQTASIKAVHATRESVMAWLENRSEGVISTVWTIAHSLGCTEESTAAVLAGLYAGLKVDRCKVGEEWGYIIGTPKLETQHEATAEVCGEQIAESSPQPALSSTNEPQASAEILPCAEHILPGGELALPSRGQVHELADLLKQPMPIMPAIVEDIYLDKPDDVEFAIFCSGGLDIYCAETTVTLTKDVLGKLRAFLGLFQEAV